MTGSAALSQANLHDAGTPSKAVAQLALPFMLFTLMPVLPMLVLLADVLPRGVAIGGKSYAFALFVVTVVATLTTAVALLVQRGVRAFVQAPLAGPLLAMIGTALLAGIIGVSFRASLFEILTETGTFIAFIAIVWNVWDERVRRALLTCYFTTGIAAAIFGIALTLTKHPPEMFAYQHGRAAGTFLQPNEFGGYLLFFIPLGLAQAAAPPLLRRLGAAAAIIGVIALSLSVSRAAWLGLLIALPILVWRFGRNAKLTYVIAAIAALVLGTTTFRDVAHDPSENPSRIAVWQGAMRMAQRFALTGVGPLGFSKVYPLLKQPDAAVDEVHAHDLPLNVLVENGVLGFAAFIWTIVASVAQARRTRNRIANHDRERLLLYYALVAAFVASSLQALIDVVSTFVLLLWWPMLGLMFSLAGSPSRARDAAVRQSEPMPAPGTLQTNGIFSFCRSVARALALANAPAFSMVRSDASDELREAAPPKAEPSEAARADEGAAKLNSPDDSPRGEAQASAARAARIVAFVCALLLIAGCSNSVPRTAGTPTPLPISAPAAYYIVANAANGQPVELKDIRNGQLEYLLRAAQITYATADSIGTLSDVLLSFYKGRTIRLKVTAPTAEVRPNDRNVALRGGVRAAGANGASMHAESMEYDGNRHVLLANGSVKAQDDRGNSIDGDRAEADLDLRLIHVWGPGGEQTMTFGK